MKLKLFFVTFLLLPILSCTSSSGNFLNISGQAYFDSNHPIANQTLSVDLIANGNGLFINSTSCDDPVQHMPGTFATTVETDDTGHFVISLGISQLGSMARNSISSSTCLAQFGTISNISSLSIAFSIPGGDEICEEYCDVFSPETLASCMSNCTAGSRRILATASVAEGSVQPTIQNQTVIFNTLGFALTEGGPDLAMDEVSAENSYYIETVNFAADSCNYLEECVRGTGARKLLRFDGVIMNIGDQDIVLGNPADNPSLFEYSECHGHYHSAHMVNYELVDPDTNQVVEVPNEHDPTETDLLGRKQGYCLTDARHVAGSNAPQYTSCHYMAMTAGWADVYAGALDCQWLDITDVPPGNYKLRLTVNPDRILTEADYDNNVVEADVTIP